MMKTTHPTGWEEEGEGREWAIKMCVFLILSHFWQNLTIILL